MGNEVESIIYEFEGFRLDAGKRLLWNGGEQPTPLKPKVFDTLLYLVSNHGKIIEKDELMSAIWPDTIVEENNLNKNISVLRRVLGENPNDHRFIVTVPGKGYKFVASVSEVANGKPPSTASHQGGSLESFFGNDDDTVLSVNRHAALHEKDRHQRLYNVQRRGNVLALADWTDTESRTEQNEAASDQSSGRLRSAPNPRTRIALYALVSILLLAATAFVWFNSSVDSNSPAARNDLNIVHLTNGEDVREATISPDGKFFAYHSNDGEKSHLWLQQTGQSKRVELIPPLPFGGDIYYKTFTPDSRFLYFMARERSDSPITLYRVPALGGVLTQILNEISTPVSFSPDGREMAYTYWDQKGGEWKLVIAASDGSSKRTLLTLKDTESVMGHVAWSPDGNLIAAVVADQRRRWDGAASIVGIDTQTGAIRELSSERWDNCFQVVWTGDGQGLVFVGTKFRESYSTRRDQVYYLSLADGQSRRLTSDGSRHQISIGITRNDEIIAVPFNRSSQIWSMEPTGDSRTAVQLTTGLADGRPGLAQLPDGRLGYVTRSGDNLDIWIMDADGANRKQLTSEPSNVEELRATSDGRYFVFSARRDGRSHLYRIDTDGSDLTQLTFGDSIEIDSTISPDGRWVVYGYNLFDDASPKVRLRKISIDGGKPVPFSDVACETPHFSPDGRSVSCVMGDGKLAIISTDDGSLLKVFEPVRISVLNVGARWTPDGQALMSIAERNRVGNIWLHPINGDPPRPLTDFTSGDVYNFAFSHDDSRLYVARGYQIRNAVLITNFR